MHKSAGVVVDFFFVVIQVFCQELAISILVVHDTELAKSPVKIRVVKVINTLTNVIGVNVVKTFLFSKITHCGSFVAYYACIIANDVFLVNQSPFGPCG
jgi:hypothetical protein